MKKIFKRLLIFIIIVAVIISGAWFFIRSGKKVSVDWTEDIYKTGLQKTKIKIANIEGINLYNIANKGYTTKGKNKVEINLSSEEMSSLISKANDNKGPIKDFKVKFGQNNDGELSFKISDSLIDLIKNSDILSSIKNIDLNYTPLFAAIGTDSSLKEYLIKYISTAAEGMPVYASGKLVKKSSNSVDIDIQILKVGQISLPQDIIDQVEEEVIKFVNSFLSKSNGFSIEELRVENGILYYKGTLPAEISEAK